MKWLAITLGALVGLAALVTIVGAFRPADHEAALAVHLDRPRAEVWAVVTDFTATPRWFSEVASSERIADIDGRPAWRERFGGFDATLVERERVDGARIVREILPSGSFSGTWAFDLADDGSGTRLTVTERGHVGNPFFRGMMVFSDNSKTMRQYVDALARKLSARLEVVGMP